LLKGRTWRNVAIGLVIAALALFLTFRKTNWSELLSAFGETSWLPLLAVLPFLALSYVFRIYRWKVLLGPISRVSFRTATGPLVTGFMVNSLLPGRVGEILRALLLSRKTGIPRAASFATVVLARLFDGLTLSAMTLCVLGAMWNMLDSGIRTGFVAATAMYLVVLIVLIMLRVWREKVIRVITAPIRFFRFHGLAGKAEKILTSFAEGLEVLRNRTEVLVVALLSLCVWACLIISVVPVFISLGLQLRWYYPVLVLVLAGFGMLIPTPAGTGTVHYALGVILPAITAIESNSAKVLAIIFHATQFIPVIIAGLVSALKEGVNTSTVEELSERETGKDPPL